MRAPAALDDVPIWAINLDHRPDRWTTLCEHLAERKLPPPQRWSAVDGLAENTDAEVDRYHRADPAGNRARRASLGIAKSHHGLLTHLAAGSQPWTLVLEDDAEFLRDVHDRWTPFAEQVPDDVLMILLGCVHRNRPQQLTDTLWRARKVICSHAYLASAEAVPLLRDAVAPLTTSFDWAWNAVHALGRTYVPSPHLAVQRVGYSDVAGRISTRPVRQYGPEYR